jgi:trehalose 6-phosphate synthase/phosphatase
VFTCTVGKKPSAAASYLHDVNEVKELLDALVKVSTRDQKYYSSVDLRNFQQDSLGVTNAFDRFDTTLAGNAGLKRPMSLGSLEAMSAIDTSLSSIGSDQKISANLGEYLGAIEDNGEDEDEPFFF